MSVLKEFKEFAIKGNAIDMAVGIVIGGAFGKVVTSLVNDIIMPPIGFLTGGIDFSAHKLILRAAAEGVDEVAMTWGMMANSLLNFVIVAFAIFMVVKFMNRLKRQEAAAPTAPAVPPPPSSEEKLLTEIRDLLKK